MLYKIIKPKYIVVKIIVVILNMYLYLYKLILHLLFRNILPLPPGKFP